MKVCRLNFDVTQKIYDTVAQTSEHMGMSVAAFLRQALYFELYRLKKLPPEHYRTIEAAMHGGQSL